jgi:hypothetical protein
LATKGTQVGLEPFWVPIPLGPPTNSLQTHFHGLQMKLLPDLHNLGPRKALAGPKGFEPEWVQVRVEDSFRA